MMTQPGECLICLTPVTGQSTSGCCHQPCHAACATNWKKHRHTFGFPYCRQDIPISLLHVDHPQLWKEDPHFVEQVKRVCKDNPLWYGIHYDGEDPLEGFWGELHDPYEPNNKTLHFLGHNKRQVIPRMKTCLSFL